MPLTKIQSLGITDGTIVNADINASAAIAGTKLTGVGKVLQVVQATKTDTFTTTSTSFVDVTGLSVSITPSSASNKILILVNSTVGASSGAQAALNLLKDSTDIFKGDTASSRGRSGFFFYSDSTFSGSPYYGVETSAITYLDSPSTTSSTTYKMQVKVSSGGTFYLNRSGLDTDNSSYSRTVSSITVLEIAA